MFSPNTVAVIGATDREGSVGRTVLERLRIPAFRGRIYPVNPKHTEILGLRCYPKIADVPEKVDLAVIVTPATTVPGVIGECVDAGVRAAVVISAGFKECGAGRRSARSRNSESTCAAERCGSSAPIAWAS